jgi:pilus assembly protein CpaB
MRATAVRVNEIVGVAGFLYPGSHVDVLATLTPPGGTGPLTETILQDVEVLTAGQTSEPDSQGKPQSVNVVTLLLSPQDSQKLLLTSTQGSIQFVLRSGADKSTAEIAATRLDQVLGMQQAPQAAPAGASKARSRPAPRRQPPPAAAPPPREPQVMEVIQGTQRTVQKFPE